VHLNFWLLGGGSVQKGVYGEGKWLCELVCKGCDSRIYVNGKGFAVVGKDGCVGFKL
jgi:hypothetical protein